MATHFPFPSSKARVRAMSSANWAEIPDGKGFTSMVSKLEATAYPALLLPSKTKLLPSVYQISSGLVRGSSLTITLWVLSSGPRFLGKSERGRQEGSWVKNLTRRYSQAWIFHQHYLTFEDSFIRLA